MEFKVETRIKIISQGCGAHAGCQDSCIGSFGSVRQTGYGEKDKYRLEFKRSSDKTPHYCAFHKKDFIPLCDKEEIE